MPVAEATFVMTGPGGVADSPERAQQIETAMLAAVQKAQAEGVTNPEEIRARIRAAINGQPPVLPFGDQVEQNAP